MPSLNPAERKLAAQVAIRTRWAQPGAREEARQRRWQQLLDRIPAEVTDPAERERLAEHLMRADLARMNLAKLKAQRARREARRAETLDELDQLDAVAGAR